MISEIQSNFYHYCKHNNAKPLDICLYKKENPDKDLRLGALPFDWIKDFDKSEIPELTQKIDTIFYNYAKETANFKSCEFKSYNENLKKSIAETLKRDDVDVEYIGAGFFKNCQKITVGDYAYKLSTFKSDWKAPYRSLLSGSHGMYSEPAKIFYVYKNYSHGRVAKPFMSRPAEYSQFRDNGYILSKYIDKNDTQRAKGELDPIYLDYCRIIHTDKERKGNEILGVITDVGGMEDNHDYIHDKEQRNSVVFFSKALKNYQFLTKDRLFGMNMMEADNLIKAEADAEDYVYNLLTKTDDFYEKDVEEITEPLYELEKELAIEKIGQLKSVHKLKTKLQKEGKFEECLNYLLKFKHNSWRDKSMQYEVFGR